MDTIKYLKMMHFYSKTKKRLRDTNDRDMATHKCLSIPDGRDLDIYLVEIE